MQVGVRRDANQLCFLPLAFLLLAPADTSNPAPTPAGIGVRFTGRISTPLPCPSSHPETTIAMWNSSFPMRWRRKSRNSRPTRWNRANEPTPSWRARSSAIAPSTLSLNPYTATPQEAEYSIIVNFTWKDLRTGKILVSRQGFEQANTYFPNLGEGQYVASENAVERLALGIVNEMEGPW